MDYLCYGDNSQTVGVDQTSMTKAVNLYFGWFPRGTNRYANRNHGEIVSFLYTLISEGVEPTPQMLSAFAR